MREIKFKAWVKSERKMYHDVRVGSDGISIFGFKKENHNEWVYFHPEDIELMQYTGLKDKNGKEIYENDIFICSRFHKNNDQYLKFKVYYKGSGFYFYLFSHRSEYPDAVNLFNSVSSENTEVIGNPYENLELLEDN